MAILKIIFHRWFINIIFAGNLKNKRDRISSAASNKCLPWLLLFQDVLTFAINQLETIKNDIKYILNGNLFIITDGNLYVYEATKQLLHISH